MICPKGEGTIQNTLHDLIKLYLLASLCNEHVVDPVDGVEQAVHGLKMGDLIFFILKILAFFGWFYQEMQFSK
jgi:hypothetical protein